MTTLQHVTTFENAQSISDYGFESTHGESGRGVYFFNPKSSSMRDYYLKTTHTPIIITVQITDPILDLTSPTIKKELKLFAKQYLEKSKIDDYIYKDPYLIETFMNSHYPQYQAYITRHFGSGIPDSKQYIVRNPRIIKIMSIK